MCVVTSVLYKLANHNVICSQTTYSIYKEGSWFGGTARLNELPHAVHKQHKEGHILQPYIASSCEEVKVEE